MENQKSEDADAPGKGRHASWRSIVGEATTKSCLEAREGTTLFHLGRLVFFTVAIQKAMGSSLVDCWDDWADKKEGGGERHDTPPEERHPTNTEEPAYSKHFVSSVSAKRATGSRDEDGSLWTIMDTIEDWKEEQKRVNIMTLVVMATGYAMLLLKINALNRKLSERP